MRPVVWRTIQDCEPQSLHNCHPQVQIPPHRGLATSPYESLQPFLKVTAEQSLPKPEASARATWILPGSGLFAERSQGKRRGFGGPGFFSSVPAIAQEAWDSCQRMGAKVQRKGMSSFLSPSLFLSGGHHPPQFTPHSPLFML